MGGEQTPGVIDAPTYRLKQPFRPGFQSPTTHDVVHSANTQHLTGTKATTTVQQHIVQSSSDLLTAPASAASEGNGPSCCQAQHASRNGRGSGHVRQRGKSPYSRTTYSAGYLCQLGWRWPQSHECQCNGQQPFLELTVHWHAPAKPHNACSDWSSRQLRRQPLWQCEPVWRTAAAQPTARQQQPNRSVGDWRM